MFIDKAPNYREHPSLAILLSRYILEGKSIEIAGTAVRGRWNDLTRRRA